ncbi:MAG TPA: hypothetical protein PLN31_10985 [Azoarcus taiwanensis]|nr:hypothetical protein [Azoarcus taiwanensis]
MLFSGRLGLAFAAPPVQVSSLALGGARTARAIRVGVESSFCADLLSALNASGCLFVEGGSDARGPTLVAQAPNGALDGVLPPLDLNQIADPRRAGRLG